jgi:hypothetical protein
MSLFGSDLQVVQSAAEEVKTQSAVETVIVFRVANAYRPVQSINASL